MGRQSDSGFFAVLYDKEEYVLLASLLYSPLPSQFEVHCHGQLEGPWQLESL